ncbi:ionotropic receptor 75a-like [Uranotaenia lowii]|uniref:ionotropic receptor 75a-like n=1 Tax=Uranotaenia lowii TaxID=190385 RepID=UPI002479B9F4|nr:ionotropic receptor 75a-like [Uranotaenia lowii]
MNLLTWSIFLFGFPISIASASHFGAIEVILGYLKIPLEVSILTCWNESEKFIFWKNLFDRNLPIRSIRMSAEEIYALPWNDPHQHYSVIVVDLACPNTKSLIKASDQMLYYHVKWIVVNTNESDCDSVVQDFQDLHVLISNEIFILCKLESYEGYIIKQVYRYSRDTNLIQETIGWWQHGVLEFKSAPNQPVSIRRRNLNGFQFRASLVITNNASLNHLEDYRDKHVDTITKKNYFLTKYMVESLNATVRFSYVKSWGYPDPKTNRFDGMIGELQTDTADLGGSALFFTTSRIKVIDYLSMTTPTRAKFIFRSPKLSVTDNVFVLPFSGTVWLCIISFIVLSGCLLLAIMLVEYHYTTIRYGSNVRPTLMDTLLNMFGTSCQQGSYLEPKSLPARCLILLSLVVLMFLYASYSANIVALIQSPSRKIQNVEDLLNSRLEVGAEDTVYNKYYFAHETEKVRKALYERKMKNREGALTGFISLEKGVERIRQGLYAFNVEVGVCYKLISETYQEDEKCGLQEIEYLNIIDPYYAIQKNSSFKELIKVTLFRLREYGMQDREQSMLYTKKPTCSGGSSFIPVSIVDVRPALILLAWGFGIACAALIVEKVWFKLRIRQQNSTRVLFKRSSIHRLRIGSVY